LEERERALAFEEEQIEYTRGNPGGVSEKNTDRGIDTFGKASKRSTIV